MLYKQLHIENYKSFENITFNLTSKKDTPKNIAIIYGPNGSGKSSLLEVFTTVYNLMHTMSVTNTLNYLQEKLSSNKKDFDIDDIQILSSILSKHTSSTAELYDQIKGTDEQKPTIIKIEFQNNGLNGSYEIQLYNQSIIYEELNYVLSKNQSCFFKLNNHSFYINKSLFKTKKEYNNILDVFSQSWGKHSILSLINNEISNYNNTYIENSFSKPFIDLLHNFEKINYRICNYASTEEHLGLVNNYLLQNISHGYIKKTSRNELKKLEAALLPVLKIAIDDLISIKYIIDNDYYHLELIKLINNKKIPIHINNEASGIKEIIGILPYIIKAISGDIVILDEYANHIHDSIAYNFIRGILPLIKGQLIISTHNTILLNSSDDKLINSFYFIEVKDSVRSIKSIYEIETKVRTNYNYQKKYIFDSLYMDYRNRIPPMQKLYDDAIGKYQTYEKSV